MLQPQLRTDIAVLDDLEGGSFGSRKHLQPVNGDLDLPGRDGVVHGRTHPYASLCAENELRTDGKSAVEHVLRGVFVKCKLNNAASVAQIDEYQASEVTRSLHPAHYADLLSDIAFAEFTAVFCSFVLFGQ